MEIQTNTVLLVMFSIGLYELIKFVMNKVIDVTVKALLSKDIENSEKETAENNEEED